MGAGGGDLEGAAGFGLAAHLGEIGVGGLGDGYFGALHFRQRPIAFQVRDDFREIGGGDGAGVTDSLGLNEIAARHDDRVVFQRGLTEGGEDAAPRTVRRSPPKDSSP